jgi:hydroxymethylglutaryl-CoA reductase
MSKRISGFSKLSKEEKLRWLNDNYLQPASGSDEVLKHFWLEDNPTQKIIDGFSENTVSNYILPYGLAPNFLVDGKLYCVPMVIEESSVVAAAAAAAKYWLDRGGFKTTILGTTKIGQIHFKWSGPKTILEEVLKISGQNYCKVLLLLRRIWKKEVEEL